MADRAEESLRRAQRLRLRCKVTLVSIMLSWKLLHPWVEIDIPVVSFEFRGSQVEFRRAVKSLQRDTARQTNVSLLTY